jgi:hypothetical protein
MGWWKRFRESVAGPPHIKGGTDDPSEVDAVMRAEYAAASSGDTEMKDIEELSEAPAAPIAAAPFTGEGEIRATEIETGMIKPGDVMPDETDIEPEEGPITPAT